MSNEAVISRSTSITTPPRWVNCDAYLFDIDGTLLNARDAVHYNAFHSAVKHVFGVDSLIDGVPVHGNTDIGILRAVVRRAGLSDTAFEERLQYAREHMCSEVGRNSNALQPELCPSIADLLDSLKSAGKLMGVVSGNLEAIGWLKLRAAGIAEYFDFGCFSDQAEFRADIFRNGVAEVHQRLGPLASVCFVGDTPSDVQAARELGLPVIAVATGIYDREALTPHGPDACVECCTELLAHL
ncbi:MAG TPA: HAD family hydrolase [Terriglobales bacterium]|nr:HAD family hydrolase [Terriglobales bacterium]